MPADATLTPLLYGFLFVLSRVAGVFTFIQLPGLKSGPEPARVVLALGFTLVLAPHWPTVTSPPTAATMLYSLLGETALGLSAGLVVALMLECLQVAAQVVGLQAGYAYASTIDPTTQADSSVLLVFAQLCAGLLFFAMGLDREVLRILARSLEIIPAGQFRIAGSTAEFIVRLGGGMLSTGLRLALPAVAVLVLVDVALALLGRVNAQLQLLSLAFPIKMIAGLTVLALTSAIMPRVIGEFARAALAGLRLATGY
jgi:flagellar biosynthetic protein FliR